MFGLTKKEWSKIKRIPFIPSLPLAACLILGALTFGAGSAYGDWQLVWSDDFTNADGSSPDPTKWGYDIGNGSGGWGNAQLEYDTSRTNNVRIQGGNLVIEADQESYNNFNYTSTRMNTKGKWSWTYGRIEARIKIPKGQGIWPAFWMLGANINSAGWPTCGEMDIMENIGKTSDQGTEHGTIHGPQGTADYNYGSGVGSTYTLPGGALLSDDFHIYAIEWTTNQIKWFLDTNNFFTATPASLPSGGTWVFTAPQFIILNVAVGGNWPGNPDGTTVFPQQMLVDYVHVYSYMTTSVPDVPTGLSVAPAGTQVVLSWSPSNGATNYNVKSSTTNGGPYITIGSTSATSFTNTGLANGTTYYYVVSAVNSYGESTNSAQISATTTVPSANLALNKPVMTSSNESAAYPGSNAVDGNYTTRWSSAFSDPQWIYVDLQAYVNVNRVKLTWENAYATSFEIDVSPDATNWTSIYSTTTGTGGTNNLTGLSGTGRYVRMYGTVRKTIYGYSLWEFEVYGNIFVPTNLTATAGNQQVTLSWNAVPAATSYNVKRSTTSGGPYTTIGSPTTAGYTDTNVVNGNPYYYVVSQVNAVAESSNSVQVIATPVCTPPAAPTVGNNGPILAGATLNLTASTVLGATYSWTGPNGFTSTSQNPSIVNAATSASGLYSVTATVGGCTSTAGTTTVVVILIPTPTGLTATTGNTQVTLSWNASSGATSYNVKSSTTNGGPYVTIASPTTTSYTNTSLVNGTTYYYVVSATNSACESANSAQVSATPTTPANSTNNPPVLAAISNQTIMAGRTLLVTNSASDPNIPPLPLTFSLLTASTNAAINSSNGLFTWRPTIAQSPSTQTVAVVVSDNGTPIMSATQSFTTTVTQPAVPALNAGSITNGQFGFWIYGDTGPDYTILASTNLASWNPIFTINSPSLPYYWVDTNSAVYPDRYYRTLLGP
jgi:beta-glucanase (GH16 family)